MSIFSLVLALRLVLLQTLNSKLELLGCFFKVFLRLVFLLLKELEFTIPKSFVFIIIVADVLILSLSLQIQIPPLLYFLVNGFFI